MDKGAWQATFHGDSKSQSEMTEHRGTFKILLFNILVITSGEKKWGRGKTGVGNEEVQTIIYKINKHSQSYGFSSGSVLHIMWPKYWSFSFSLSPSNEYLGLISFRIDWFDLLAVQGTLKSLLQHHSSKALVLRRSAFFIVQLSHPYMTTGKTIALTRQAGFNP